MKPFFRQLSALFVGVVAVWVTSCNNRQTQQVDTPAIDSIKVWVGDTIRCYSECTYVMLTSGWEDEVMAKINRHNYEQLFQEHALPDTMDVYAALEADRLNDFDYILDWKPEDIIGAPLWSKYTQTATIVQERVLCINTFCAYYHGGSHEIIGMRNCNYDLTTGEYIDLAYLEEGEWLPKLQRLLYKRLPEDDCFVYIMGHSPEDISFDSKLVEIIEDGIRITFKPYAVACFAAGFISVELSNRELDIFDIPTPWVKEDDVQ